MVAKKQKDITREVAQLKEKGQDASQKALELAKFAEMAQSTFESLSDEVTTESAQCIEKANIELQVTIDTEPSEASQKSQEVYNEFENKQKIFKQAIAADKSDLIKLNSLKKETEVVGESSSEIKRVQESKQDEIIFLNSLTQDMEVAQELLKKNLDESKQRRQAARINNGSKIPKNPAQFRDADKQIYESSWEKPTDFQLDPSYDNGSNSFLEANQNQPQSYTQQTSGDKTGKPKIDWCNLKTTPEERTAYAQRIRQGPSNMSEMFLNEAEARQKDKYSQLYPEEMAALAFYTAEQGYRPINRLLRGDLKNFKADLSSGWSVEQAANDYLEHARFITAALNKLPDYKFMVWRGAKLTPNQIAKYKVGKMLTEDAFTSTSTSINVVKRFSDNVFYTIMSRTGKLIRNLSEFEGEEEVLFRPGTRFKVLAVEEEGGITKIRMVELGQDGSEWWN